MAEYNISQQDIYLLKKPKKMHLKAYLLNSHNQTVGEFEGYIIEGSGSEDCTSDIRRTCNFTVHSYDSTYNVGEYQRFWINNRVRIEIGFEDFGTIYYYNKGIFVFDSCQYTYTGSEKSLSFSCSDLVTTLDGTHGGTLDGVSFLIKGCVYDTNTDTWSGSDIKKCVEDLLIQNGITEFRVESIGQVCCLQGKSTNWVQNRIDTGTDKSVAELAEQNGFDDLNTDAGTWHMIPYDLEFNSGVTLWEILTKIRDLYPGYEMYFDKDGMFIFQLIPTCEHDDYVLDYSQMKGLVIKEDSSLDFSTVKNATRVYGESVEYDYCASSPTLSNVSYDNKTVSSVKATISNFILANNATVGIKFPSFTTTQKKNIAYLTIEEHTFPIVKRKAIIEIKDNLPVNTIVYENLTYGDLANEDVYCFKYMSSKKIWVFVGMYQIEGYCEDNDPNSPFAIDKIGYKLQVLSGGEYDDITTSTLAQERAEYENWLAGRFQDNITLEMVIIPFLETNKKIQYKKLSDDTIDFYIVKNISYSLGDATMNITMSKFYELDPFIVCS